MQGDFSEGRCGECEKQEEHVVETGISRASTLQKSGTKENAGEKNDEIKCCQNCPGRFSEGRSGECGILLR